MRLRIQRKALTFDFIRREAKTKKNPASLKEQSATDGGVARVGKIEKISFRGDLRDGKVESCNRAGMIYCFAAALALFGFFLRAWKKWQKNGSENHVLQINNRGE